MYHYIYLKHELLGEWVSHENTSNKWDILLEYHGRALHNCYSTPKKKYSGQNNQCDIRAVHDGKAGCNTVEYSTAFLYSNWLYFLRHVSITQLVD